MLLLFDFIYLFVIYSLFQLLTYGRRIPFAELFARIDAVDASTIKRVANRFIYDKVLVEPYILYSNKVTNSFSSILLCLLFQNLCYVCPFRILQLLLWDLFSVCLITTGSGAEPTGTATSFHRYFFMLHLNFMENLAKQVIYSNFHLVCLRIAAPTFIFYLFGTGLFL